MLKVAFALAPKPEPTEQQGGEQGRLRDGRDLNRERLRNRDAVPMRRDNQLDRDRGRDRPRWEQTRPTGNFRDRDRGRERDRGRLGDRGRGWERSTAREFSRRDDRREVSRPARDDRRGRGSRRRGSRSRSRGRRSYSSRYFCQYFVYTEMKLIRSFTAVVVAGAVAVGVDRHPAAVPGLDLGHSVNCCAKSMPL